LHGEHGDAEFADERADLLQILFKKVENRSYLKIF
jgi:hypothetical protein